MVVNYMHFSISKISSLIARRMMDTSVWKEACPVSIDRLKLLEVSHYNFEGQISRGQLIVLDHLAQGALDIFKELFILKFPIHSIKLMDEFGASDELSMAANNSSCFNYRPIAGTKILSMHSYGLAIDINPIQNPYISFDQKLENITVLPKKGCEFLNRTNQRDGMVEEIVKIFAKHGFSQWGGEWNDPIDYHHFQVPRSSVEKLLERSS